MDHFHKTTTGSLCAGISSYYDEEAYYPDYEEEQHFGRYAGSYAQDEMGYSDEEIDTIFDGDPSAYWNID